MRVELKKRVCIVGNLSNIFGNFGFRKLKIDVDKSGS